MPLVRNGHFLVWMLRYVIIFCLALQLAGAEDLYKILGVSRRATTKEIKSAYRRKALNTHPDKRKDVPIEVATEDFRKLVHAFEVLSDDKSRRHYDRTGRTTGSTNKERHQQRAQHHPFPGGFKFVFTQKRRTALKDKKEAKEAQARVMHIVSMEQLRTVMLGDDDLLEKHLLLCFAPTGLEKVADEDIVFPYPFAAMSSQGIWWEDLLQTVKVRFHMENAITKFFRIPRGDEMRATGKPVFVFLRRGQSLSELEDGTAAASFQMLQTKSRNEFDSWVWDQLQVSVNFVNEHDHEVELYWINGKKAKMQAKVPPGSTVSHLTRLSHEWWARDARVDTQPGAPNRHKLSPASSLGTWKITSDMDGQDIMITTPDCVDLSGHCIHWANHPSPGECHRNPDFMYERCPKTCDRCPPKKKNETETQHDEL